MQRKIKSEHERLLELFRQSLFCSVKRRELVFELTKIWVTARWGDVRVRRVVKSSQFRRWRVFIAFYKIIVHKTASAARSDVAMLVLLSWFSVFCFIFDIAPFRVTSCSSVSLFVSSPVPRPLVSVSSCDVLGPSSSCVSSTGTFGFWFLVSRLIWTELTLVFCFPSRVCASVFDSSSSFSL